MLRPEYDSIQAVSDLNLNVNEGESIAFMKFNLAASMEYHTGFIIQTFGNLTRLVDIIVEGELDSYLLQPRNVLFNVLMSSSNVFGWGNLVYGYILFFIIFGMIKVILFTLLPAGLLTMLPTDLILEFSFTKFLYLLVGVGSWFIISQFLFKLGLKEYESGNLMVQKL